MKANKQKTKKINEEIETDTFSLAKKGIVAVIVLFIFFSFYILTLYITSKHSEEDASTNYQESEEQSSTTTTSTSYDDIMLGRSLSMADEDYFVLCYDKTADNASDFSTIINNYTSLDDHLDIYSVDLSSSFNKKYLTEGESNKNPTDTSSFAINGPTLFKVSNHSVVDYIEGEEEISNYLS